ncbi:hypothetical protein NT239_05330 [Chitinibacter sp. SCUT-21]|uniref:hypothetical protein n=1 Tax=Chitinibacter sp. SCUT-21 TaxID=2970891 RepID=UPI0035A62BB9
MKYGLALLLILPGLSWSNEAAHSGEIKPATKAATTSSVHTPIKNAPPTQVDNLKPASKSKVEAGAHQTETTSTHSAKPTEPPVVQYVPPKYGSSAVPTSPPVRQYVPSKAPRSAAHSTKSSHGSSHSSSAKMTTSSPVTPGIVRVLPSNALPAGKVLPAAKMVGDGMGSSDSSTNKPRLIWGETTVVKPAALPAPEIYIVRDPELRWQQYSYP